MAKNLSDILNDFTSSADKTDLSRLLSEFKKTISTPEGRRLAEKIRSSDKEKLTELISVLKASDNPARALKQASQNPEILKKLNTLLNREEKI